MNENGQVVGLTKTFNAGDIVWFYDHESAQTHSGFDYRDQYTGGDITIHSLTDSGLVLGSNEREYPGADRHTPWLYDSSTGLTHSLIFSQSSAGQALSHIAYLSDDGAVLGEYDAYSETDEKSRRYFYWSIEHGFHDLESLVEGDLASLGWDTLATISDAPSEAPQAVVSARDIFPHDATFLWAFGARQDGYEMPFALVYVPEPASWLMVMPVFTILLLRRGPHRDAHPQKIVAIVSKSWALS